MTDINRIKEIKEKTDKVSCTFCLAKWHHTTIYLQTGETHSCYHPKPHKIPLTELANNPSALHNTFEKKLQRKEMLEGGKPKGCQYCWNIEALGPDYVSDRHERNASIYREPLYTDVITAPWDKDVNPEYIEISFGHECNFKCGYCHPKASSSFYKEIEQFGPYTTVRNHRNDIDWFKIYRKEDENPYVEAWWKWWPEVKKTLNILRITGGEPLLQNSTWKLLDSIDEDPVPWMEININSNLGVKSILVERLAVKIQKLREENKIRSFAMFSSIDTWNTRAEYIRTGLNLEVWEKNLDHYLTLTKDIPITFMITFNILTVTTFKTLLEKILEWRSKYHNESLNSSRIRFDTPYLKEPLQYDMNILPKSDFMPYMYDSLQFMIDNQDDSNSTKFSSLEVEKFRRVVRYMETTNYSEDRVLEGRKDFYHWFKEYDVRRGTDFEKTFPEMIEFYNSCKDIE